MLPFDKHPYYQVLSGRGFVGVDFIVVTPDDQLILLEVKNYAQPKGDHVSARLPRFITDPDVYQRRILRKFSDTLRAIFIVRKMLRRKVWYGILLQYVVFMKAWRPEWYFWTRVADIAKIDQQVYRILWMEIPDEIENYTVTELEKERKKLIDRFRHLDPNNDKHLVLSWRTKKYVLLNSVEVEKC